MLSTLENKLKDALELHENILHAESQAIQARIYRPLKVFFLKRMKA
jgi:hypothetical protein